MRVLVVGAGGGLGKTYRNFGPKLYGHIDWNFSDRTDLDITQTAALGYKLDFVKPDFVINASGYTAVDRAESEKDLVFAINATAVGNLAKECQKRNLFLVTYSTDYVFDGNSALPLKEKDEAQPINTYGASKLEGEKLALKYERALVIRSSWLYSDQGKSFPRKILERAVRGEEQKIVNDQFSSPTWSLDLVKATLQLIEVQEKGLFHFSSTGHCSWHDFAVKTIELYNELKHTSLPLPAAISSDQFPSAAKRPRHSILSCDRIRKRGIYCPHWTSTLRNFVDYIIRLGV